MEYSKFVLFYREYNRCMDWLEDHMDGEACQVSEMEKRTALPIEEIRRLKETQ